MRSGRRCVPTELIRPRWIFILDRRPLCSHAGMALDAAGSLLLLLLLQLLWTSSLHHAPTPRTNRNGLFQANLSLSQRRWRQPKCESRGGGRRKASSTACHCSAAAAAALEPHREDLSIRFLWYFYKHAGRTVAFAKVNGSLGVSVSTLFAGVYFAVAAGADWMRVPLRIQASDNGTSRGNFATLLPLANCIYGLC